MKKILLSVLLSFVVLAQSSAMEESHPSAIEILEKVPGFQAYFSAKFSPSEQTSLRKLFALGNNQGLNYLPSLYELIFRNDPRPAPQIPQEGLPLGFPAPLILNLNNFEQFAQLFKTLQAGYLCGMICDCQQKDANFTWAKLQAMVSNLWHTCNAAAIGCISGDYDESTLHFYLLFCSPAQAFSKIREYCKKNKAEFYVYIKTSQ
jgi:hypothetical protein